MKFFDYSMVKDPTYFKDGRMEAHSDHTYYRDTEEAAEKETSFRYDLNGIWKFHYARNYGSAVQGFEAKDYCCRDWDDIRGTEVINEEKPLDGEEIYSWTVQAPVLWSAEDPQLYDLTKDRLRNCKKCKSIRKESCI